MSDLSGFSMWELFRGEVAAQMQVLADSLLAVESGADPKEHLQAAMRAAHSIKGAARIVQLDPAVQLAHAMEDCLVAAQKSEIALDSAATDLLLRSGDTLAATAKVEEAAIAAWAESNSDVIESLLAQLSDLRAGKQIQPQQMGAPGASPLGTWETLTPIPSTPQPSTNEGCPVQAPLGRETTPPTQPLPDQPPTPPTGDSPPTAPSTDQALKVASAALNRIMGLAGEALVAGRRLESFNQPILALSRRQQELSEMLHRLADLIGSGSDQAGPLLAEVAHKHSSTRESLSRYHADLESFALSSLVTSEKLYHEVVATRMRPFGDLIVGYPRLVRDLSRQLAKQVRLDLLGQTTPVDREIQERLEAPLNHIVRNCLDHGIEPPADREAAGKSATATIRIEARHLAGQFVVTIADDGHGIDLERLRAIIVEKSMAPPELARDFTEEELIEFLFLPGFSTASKVTDISGRGVGLDAVRMMAKSVGGSVQMTTRLGAGTTTTIALPLTLSVVRTLIAEVAGEPYAIPLTRIGKVIELDPAALRSLEGHSYAEIDGEQVGLVSARALFDKDNTAPASGTIPVILLGSAEARLGLVVDRFLGEQDLVVRPLDRRLGKVQDIGATALLEDGTPVLILDTGDMLLSMQARIKGGRLRGITRSQAQTQGKRRILVVEDSITVRELERSLLAAEGYDVEVAVDGQDGWNALRSSQYDLLVTDVDMPRMTGLELVERVRADVRLRKLPIVMVSYKDREEDRLRGLEAGADRYMTKNSFHEASWKATISELLGAAE